MSDESVTLWIKDLKQGDDAAAEALWERYFGRLVGVGKRILKNANQQPVDGEDAAISAFKSVCLRARDDRFPKLNDRDDLWKLLVTIVSRKSFKIARKSKRTKSVSEEQYFEEAVIDSAPTAAMAMEMDDTMEEMLARLEDERMRRIALGKLEGKTNKELAEEMGRSISFIERKLQLIRRIWSTDSIS
ncbi:MAG: ECF-type sigma factor [bacterium]|nr:ECF-type sigma factor [bacterium]